MSGLELNKIMASVLVAALVGMFVGQVTHVLYKPKLTPEKRGFEIAVTGAASAGSADVAPVEIKIGQLMAAASVEAGAALAKKCATCHSFDKGGANKVGPNMYGIVGAKKAHLDTYAYSEALKTAGGTWDYDSLYHFINAPKKLIKGTKMSFAGLGKPEDVANVIAYLRSLSDSPVPLPAVEQ